MFNKSSLTTLCAKKNPNIDNFILSYTHGVHLNNNLEMSVSIDYLRMLQAEIEAIGRNWHIYVLLGRMS